MTPGFRRSPSTILAAPPPSGVRSEEIERVLLQRRSAREPGHGRIHQAAPRRTRPRRRPHADRRALDSSRRRCHLEPPASRDGGAGRLVPGGHPGRRGHGRPGGTPGLRRGPMAARPRQRAGPGAAHDREPRPRARRRAAEAAGPGQQRAAELRRDLRHVVGLRRRRLRPPCRLGRQAGRRDAAAVPGRRPHGPHAARAGRRGGRGDSVERAAGAVRPEGGPGPGGLAAPSCSSPRSTPRSRCSG